MKYLAVFGLNSTAIQTVIIAVSSYGIRFVMKAANEVFRSALPA